MSKSDNIAALAVALLLIVAFGAMQAISQRPAPATQPETSPAYRDPRQRQVATEGPPFSIDVDMLMVIDSLPTALTETITANTYSDTEIIKARQSSKVPLEPMAPWVSELWCITIYPEATMTMYVEPYVIPKDALVVQAGDFVPGEARTGMIDHFLALKRGDTWELYHPEVYSRYKLGC